jgi:methylenetetrahydrofolate reductase (NADPH)
MKVIEHIAKSNGKTLFTFELLPPLKGDSIENIYSAIDPLIEFNPAFIDVTYHREEVIYKKHPGGLLEKKVVRKRPSTVGISAAIQYKYKVDVVPHIICGGFTREETENGLLDLHFLGIHNLLLLRGDTLKSEKYFTPEDGGHAYAIDLVKQVLELNQGKYLDENLQHKAPTSFSIGVAGYPEKHIESPNMAADIHYLKMKVDAGAEYIVTQMFFDNRKYFEFVRLCREQGITVPIIPGIKPISTIASLNTLPQVFNIDIPNELVREVEKCQNNEQARQLGVEYAIVQARELIAAGVPALHFYTMGRSDNIRKIVMEVF